MSRPRLLDLYCCAGGCSEGFARAGFEVEGVDNEHQPNYPYTFHLADALDFLEDHWHEYDAFSASPPCQHASTQLRNRKHIQALHPNLIPATQERLKATGKPYVIENVVGARTLAHSITLCGLMFGLRVYRHRRFESNILLFQPEHPRHILKAAHAAKIPAPDEFWCPVGHFGQKDEAQKAMGITWMKTVHEIAQAIPPAYTAWIAPFLLAAVQANQEVAV